MGPLNLALWGAGGLLLALGLWRARGPYRRARALQANEENLRRYESWRGGRRTAEDRGPSSADLMGAELRGQVRRWAALAGVGAVILMLGFLVRP